jgi:hypothetical protein
MPSNFKALAGASGGEPNDPNFKNVTLLLHGDGSNGAQNNTFLDSSTNNFTITRNGNTTQGSFSPYGSNWSNYFDGTGDYLTAPDNAPLQLGSSNFTIEFWVNFSVVPGASQGATLVSKFDTGNTGYEVILYSNTLYFQAQTASIGMTYAWTPTAGRWYHIAWTRSGSNSYGFIDGALVASTSSASGSITNLNQALQIGRRGDNTFYLNGYMSNVRILKGTALYTSNFTPPTAPLTAITNTSLLTCADNRFRDGSTNNFTITRNGDVKVTNFAPFAPSSSYSTTTNGGSAYFDGTGDYLDVPNNTAFDQNTSFTVEMWLYPTASVVDKYIYSQATTNFLQVATNPSGNIGIDKSGVTVLVSASSTLPLYTWTHVAMVSNGSTVTLYVNGVSQGSASVGTTVTSASTVRIGAYQGTGTLAFPGYISNLRVVKGTAVYTANFTPPTSPVTAISGTGLLINATNAAIFDNSMKNDLETVGNAQISTSVKKFGTGSMYFDGSGDYLAIPTGPQLYFGTSDFTVEAWIYPTGGSGNRHIFSGNITSALGFCVNTSGKIAVAKSGVVEIIASTTTISTSTFTHVAATRSGNTFRIFVNGTLEATVTSSQDFSNFSDNRVGFEAGSSAYLGYIDDLRVTAGLARYTANFTPPTAAFPNK